MINDKTRKKLFNSGSKMSDLLQVLTLKSACPCVMQYIHLVQNYILVNDLDNNCENLVDYFSVR